MPITGVTVGTGVTVAPGITFTGYYDGALVLATDTSPGIVAYQWSDEAGLGTKYADPSTLPTGTAEFVAFNPAGTAVVLSTNSSPYVFAYAWNKSTGFGTKYANPSVALVGRPRTRPSWTQNLFGSVTGTSINLYQWSDSTGFGSKYSYPALGSNQPFSIAINPLENAISISTSSGTYSTVRAWQFDLTTGFGAEQNVDTSSASSVMGVWGPNGTALATNKYSGDLCVQAWDPGTNTPGTLYTSTAPGGTDDIAWTPDQSVVFVTGGGSAPYVWALPWSNSTGIGAKYTDATTTGAVGTTIAVSSAGKSVAVTDNAVNLTVYRWSNSTGWGTKYDVSSIPGNIYCATFMP